MVQILETIQNKRDRQKKRVFKQSTNERINNFMIKYFGVILVAILLLLLALFLSFSFIVIGASLESGNYYNHLGDVVC